MAVENQSNVILEEADYDPRTGDFGEPKKKRLPLDEPVRPFPEEELSSDAQSNTKFAKEQVANK